MQLGGAVTDATTISDDGFLYNSAYQSMVRSTLSETATFEQIAKNQGTGLKPGYEQANMLAQAKEWAGGTDPLTKAEFGDPFSLKRRVIVSRWLGTQNAFDTNTAINAAVIFGIQATDDGTNVTGLHVGDFCAAYTYDFTTKRQLNTLKFDGTANQDPLRILIFMLQFDFSNVSDKASILAELDAAKLKCDGLSSNGIDQATFVKSVKAVAGATQEGAETWGKIIKAGSINVLATAPGTPDDAVFNSEQKSEDERLAAAPKEQNELYWIMIAMGFELEDVRQNKAKVLKFFK